MRRASKLSGSADDPPDAYPPPRRASQFTARAETLVALRWLAIAGQLVAILVSQFVIGIPLPLAPTLLTVIAAAVFNLAVATARRSAGQRLAPRRAMLHLAFDVVQLALLLGLTGGLGNPFALLLLVPVTVAASVLGPGETLALGGLAAGAATLLAPFHLPLAGLPSPEPLYVLGVWVALLLGMAFLALYAWRVAHEARLLAAALTETQVALARETELARLGGLAAAAAHELGTPLGTMALAAGELGRALPPDGPLAGDVARLKDAARQARAILARLTAGEGAIAGTAEAEGDTPFARLPLAALIEAAGQPTIRPSIAFEVVAASEGAQPLVRRRPEVVHGLRNLIDNAADFAHGRVVATARWTAEQIAVEIVDDGPGFALHVLDALGEPFLTTRRRAGGLGLGVFIAKTLLEHSGARLAFSNRVGGGAVVTAAWPRGMLER